MLNKLTLIILINFYVNVVHACSVPEQGEKFDSLITVNIDEEFSEKYDEAYVVTIPAYIDPYLLNGFTEDDRAMLKDAYISYRNKEDNTYVISQIKLTYSDYEVEIVATWDLRNDWCGAVSRKKLESNTSLKHGSPKSGAP